MSKTALAKTADLALNEAPDDRAALRDAIAGIIRQEYSGDICTEFWLKPARAAAMRIVELLYESRSPMAPRKVPPAPAPLPI